MRRVYTNTIISFCLCLLLPSCGDNALEQALRQSGANRPQLEQVLRHYSNHDSLRFHLQAARFLIRHMPGHQSMEGGCLPELCEGLDSLHPEMSLPVRRVVLTIPQRMPRYAEEMTPAEDISRISADFLIAHIDSVMLARRLCPWLSRITFEEFCEYVLPYRFSEEPLMGGYGDSATGWRKVLSETSRYRSLPCSSNDLRTLQRNVVGKSHDRYMQDLSMPGLEPSLHSFDCLDDCLYNLSMLRDAGIPCALDYVSDWPTRNGRHFWRVLLDPACRDRVYSEVSNPRAAKVWRRTYSHNPVPAVRNIRTENIPDLFADPFNRDVTKLYCPVSDVTVKPMTAGDRPQNLYLAVFNDLQWKPAAWARIRHGRAVFRDMGRGIVYMPVYYHGQQMRFAGDPFLLDTEGKVKTLSPSRQTQRLALTRKYPLNTDKIQWSRQLTEYIIEASNDAAFARCDTIWQIDGDSPDLGFVEKSFQESSAYRYWRIVHPRRIAVAELQFLDARGGLLSGKPLCEAGNKQGAAELAFDGDVLTYTNVQKWLGMDMGKPVPVSSIRVLPRNDDNGIVPGQWYELCYWDRDGEHSLGRQRAESTQLVFNDVPVGALYQLKNLQLGMEERIFICDNGVPVFW